MLFRRDLVVVGLMFRYLLVVFSVVVRVVPLEGPANNGSVVSVFIPFLCGLFMPFIVSNSPGPRFVASVKIFIVIAIVSPQT